MTSAFNTVIIGAGPAGLAVAARMRKAGLHFEILERAETVSPKWHEHYDRVHLHTVKRLSHLPHMPFPDAYPLYVGREDLVKYFASYAAEFNIRPRFGTVVRKVRKDGEYWLVQTEDKEFTARNVVIATGVNGIPRVPEWPGMSLYAGTITHSADYHNPEPFRGKRVLVVGMGNTGAEIALDLAEADIPVWISVRGEVNIVPRDLHGRPVQETSRLLARLPFHLGDRIGMLVQRVLYGDMSQYGLTVSRTPPAVALRTTGKTPVIDIGTMRAIREGKVVVVGDIVQFTHEGVELISGAEINAEHVILATGYRHGIEELVPGSEKFLDKHGYPKSPVGTEEFAGLYFVGFDNYKLGGILGTIHADSQTVVDVLRRKGN